MTAHCRAPCVTVLVLSAQLSIQRRSLPPFHGRVDAEVWRLSAAFRRATLGRLRCGIVEHAARGASGFMQTKDKRKDQTKGSEHRGERLGEARAARY
jgi:hypothetical protein